MSPDTDSAIDHTPAKKSHSRGRSAVANTAHRVPTTFFLRKECNMPQDTDDTSRETKETMILEQSGEKQEKFEAHIRDSSYGVQSLSDTLTSAFPAQSRDASPSRASSISQDAQPDSTHTSFPGPNSVLGKKKKAGNPIHPKILATAQRIISGEQSSRRPSSSSSYASHTSPSDTPSKPIRRTSNDSFGHGLSPLRLSPQPDTGISGTPRSASVRSLRLSDEEGSVIDETGSQAIQSSSGEEDEEEVTFRDVDGTADRDEQTSGPQLVMPSITMPSRRPFTERGKHMGRLKVMVAGRAGAGKTSLIRSIVQSCQDIVHVDPPLTISLGQDQERSAQGHRRSTNGTITAASEKADPSQLFTETYASTKPHPSWWSDIDESVSLRRRKSMSDIVLERNLCFIDTAGWRPEDVEQDSNGTNGYNTVTTLLEQLLRQNAAIESMTDSQLLSLLTGGGGCQLDAVLYLVQGSLGKDDLNAMRQIAKLTNIVPLLAQADKYSEEEIRYFKTELRSSLVDAGIKIFDFDKGDRQPGSLQVSPSRQAAPSSFFTVSSMAGDDFDNMDASLLMSSEYIKPLVDSELPGLVQHLLDPENMQWLRHNAIKKFLAWRRQQLANSLDIQAQADTHQSLPTAASYSVTSGSMPTDDISTMSEPSGVQVPHHNSTSYRSYSPSPSDNHSLSLQSQHSSSQALAPLHFPHPPPEANLRSMRLAKWALDLQHSLESERHARYARLHTTPPPSHPSALVRHGSKHTKASSPVTFNANDPLNLLSASSILRTHWPTALRILGLGSALGAAVLFLIRNWTSISDALFAPQSPSPSTYAATQSDEWIHLPSFRDTLDHGAGGSQWGLRDLFSSFSSFSADAGAGAGVGPLDASGYALVGPPVMGFDGAGGYGQRAASSQSLAAYGIGGEWLRNFGWGDWGLGEGWGLRRSN